MKKSKSPSDITDILDKQYKAMLLTIKLTATISAEVKELTSILKEQNALLSRIASSLPLEEEPV